MSGKLFFQIIVLIVIFAVVMIATKYSAKILCPKAKRCPTCAIAGK